MELNLREHQLTAIDELREGFKQGHKKQLLYAPTGYGKTEIAIYMMQATAQKYKRAAMILDRIVLVDQTSKRLDKYVIEHGVFQAIIGVTDRTNGCKSVRLRLSSVVMTSQRRTF
jgi:DNA repair protein RadD